MNETGGFCEECPDHEACSTGWPCFVVLGAHERQATRDDAAGGESRG